MSERSDKIDELHDVLTHLWFGSGNGCYTAAIQRDRLKPLLHELLGDETIVRRIRGEA